MTAAERIEAIRSHASEAASYGTGARLKVGYARRALRCSEPLQAAACRHEAARLARLAASHARLALEGLQP